MGLIRELEDVFNASFPTHILEAMIKCIFNAYKVAYNE